VGQKRKGVGVWASPNAGEAAIYGPQNKEGRCTTLGHLTRIIDGEGVLDKAKRPLRYDDCIMVGISVQHQMSRTRRSEINESILRLSSGWWPIEYDTFAHGRETTAKGHRLNTDPATKGTEGTDT
jgi:hypothetical protein